jgi:phosphoserine phosphatase
LAIPAQFSAQELTSAPFLNRQLSLFHCIWDRATDQWSLVERAELVSNNANTKEPTEQFVLVGQAINIGSLQSIFEQFLGTATTVEVSAHALSDEFAQQAIVLKVHHELDKPIMTKKDLMGLSHAHFIDCFVVSEVCLSKPGLIVMDMDSTIINMECIDEIAKLVGVGDKVSALTERAMQGELDFNQSLNARVACLEGVSVDELERLKSRLPINPGFAKTMQILQANGWTTVIASGGFTYFANYIKDNFSLSKAVSNTLEVNNDALTGKVVGDIVNGEMKRDILLQQAQEKGIPHSQTLAIGDGANDLLMMSAAALGVAYKAKPRVKQAASANIEYCGFEGLLYCLA